MLSSARTFYFKGEINANIKNRVSDEAALQRTNCWMILISED